VRWIIIIMCLLTCTIIIYHYIMINYCYVYNTQIAVYTPSPAQKSSLYINIITITIDEIYYSLFMFIL
jgi:hypothetical protein